MSQIHLSEAMSVRLSELAALEGKTADASAAELLQQSIEDRMDYLAGVASMDQQTGTTRLETLEQRFGLEG